ncbi:hypothetical protein CALCODRAFT_183498 [Calocera cornea HHB12733]|uniref:Uncharacterized protein n=1 Tax=Calocera cornea HHB12733 TaxID=1353952 RepID=A0A165CB04_9BASI|nr:hypothetical protein CALCODRAFT_183498 [Calocera cornea HHB12733]
MAAGDGGRAALAEAGQIAEEVVFLLVRGTERVMAQDGFIAVHQSVPLLHVSILCILSLSIHACSETAALGFRRVAHDRRHSTASSRHGSQLTILGTITFQSLEECSPRQTTCPGVRITVGWQWVAHPRLAIVRPRSFHAFSMPHIWALVHRSLINYAHPSSSGTLRL